jgi:hypothetical protein
MFHSKESPKFRLYRFIRDTLVALGVPVENKNRRIMIQALLTIYLEGELRDEAQFLVNDRPGRRAASESSVYQTQDFHRAIGSLLHMYKDEFSKHGGIVKENFREAFAKYLVLLRT